MRQHYDNQICKNILMMYISCNVIFGNFSFLIHHISLPLERSY